MTLPTVATGSASAVGQTAVTTNGAIHPHGLYTQYHFEYGPDTNYGKQTPPAELPPQRTAHYYESFDHGIGGWHKRDGPMEHHPTGGASGSASPSASAGASGGFVRYTSPTLDDHNHDDGIGTLHLASYLYMGAFMDEALRKSMGPHNPLLAAGEPDLRGAHVSLYVRGHNWQPNGSELLWWTQSQSNPAITRQPDWRCDPTANWAYTGHMLTDALQSGNWEHIAYKLRHHADQWSFGGFYTEQPDWKRYDYWPIDPVQAKVNYDLFHLLAFVDPDNPPRGMIDFDEFHLTYPNRSLTSPSNGAHLIAAPDSDADPARLTDGWRHGDNHTWHTAPNPNAPQQFIYAFDNPVTIQSIQIHQNSDHPAKDVRCAISTDGRTFTPLCNLTLPLTNIPHDNLAFAIQSDLAAPATHLQVTILSGYRDDRWGLGAIEAFGSGAKMLPDNEPYEVNTDINHLTPGSTLHYRLVATNAHGATRGEDQSFNVPADATPHARTDRVSRITSTSAKLEGRVNPMGKRTHYHFEYGPTPACSLRTPPTYAGLQIVPRLVFAPIDNLNPDTRYHYRLIASNDAGQTIANQAAFQTPPSH